MIRLSNGFGFGVGVGVGVVRVLAVLAVLAGMTSELHAVEIKTLYQVRMMAPDQGRKSRMEMFSLALAQVVIKVTGKTDTPTLEGMHTAMKTPEMFVSRYDYRKLPAKVAADNPQAAFFLDITFNQAMVNKLLQDNELSLWGSNRAETLIWIGIEERGERQMLGEESSLEIVQALKVASIQWGVPLLFPLLDMEDRRSLSMAEHWGLFPAAVAKASGRYGVESLLAMRVYSSADDKVNGRVMFIFRGRVWNEDISDVSADVFASSALSLVASRLAAFYAVLSDASSERPLRIQVSAVSDVHDYAKLLRYLEKLTAVRSVMPVYVKGDTLMLDLVIDGSPEQLDAEISLNRNLTKAYQIFQLAPTENVVSEPVRRSDLYYSWQK